MKDEKEVEVKLEFKCPVANPNDCPKNKLFHFAVNKMMVENSEYVLKIKELKARLKKIQHDFDAVVKDMKSLARESEG